MLWYTGNRELIFIKIDDFYASFYDQNWTDIEIRCPGCPKLRTKRANQEIEKTFLYAHPIYQSSPNSTKMKMVNTEYWYSILISKVYLFLSDFLHIRVLFQKWSPCDMVFCIIQKKEDRSQWALTLDRIEDSRMFFFWQDSFPYLDMISIGFYPGLNGRLKDPTWDLLTIFFILIDSF